MFFQWIRFGLNQVIQLYNSGSRKKYCFSPALSFSSRAQISFVSSVFSYEPPSRLIVLALESFGIVSLLSSKCTEITMLTRGIYTELYVLPDHTGTLDASVPPHQSPAPLLLPGRLGIKAPFSQALDPSPTWVLAFTIVSNEAFSCRTTQGDMAFPRIFGHPVFLWASTSSSSSTTHHSGPAPGTGFQFQAFPLVLTVLQLSPWSPVRKDPY